MAKEANEIKTDKEILAELCKKLNEVTKKEGVELRVIEIKGTTFFLPRLPAA